MIFWIFLSKFESLLVLALCCGWRCSSRGAVSNDGSFTCSRSLQPQSETEQNVITKIITNGISWPMCSNNKESRMTILQPPWHIQDTMMPTYPIKHHEIEKNDELWPRANEMALLLLSDQLNIKTQQQIASHTGSSHFITTHSISGELSLKTKLIEQNNDQDCRFVFCLTFSLRAQNIFANIRVSDLMTGIMTPAPDSALVLSRPN